MKTRLFKAANTSLLVRNGRIVAMGGADQLRAHAEEDVDLGNSFITPGLRDAHFHITEWSVTRTSIDLGAATSIEEAASLFASVHGKSFIRGNGWNPHRWGGAYPTRQALDAIVGEIPVVAQSHDMHALWLNTAALKMAGVFEFDGDPDGGRIVRDERGDPTGVLLENAAQLVVPILPRYDVDSMIPLVLDGQRELNSYGMTAIHSLPGLYIREPDPLPVLQKIHEQNQLSLRVQHHISLDFLDDAIRIGLRSGFGNEWISIGGVKMFLDGALGSRTAWMREPYEGSGDCGVQVLPEDEFRAIVTKAARAGIASTVHAIGDAAVGLAMDVLGAKSTKVAAQRHRIEHVQCLPEDWRSRFNADVICSVQPSHLMTDWRAADRHWGKRAERTYAFRDLLDAGATLIFGSDAPVEAADPRHGIYAGVTRCDLNGEPGDGWHAEQRLRLDEVLAGYTTPLTEGGLADFVAWRHDPFDATPQALLKLQPVVTVVNGEIVYGD